MTRYSVSKGIESQYQPGSKSRVLRNRLGIVSRLAVNQIETLALAKAQMKYYQSEIVSEKTQFDATIICKMHCEWLGEIYDWAGIYRKVDMSRGGFLFPPAYLVQKNMLRFETDFLQPCTPYRISSHKTIFEIAATLHSELLVIHPFRDGNGRLARWLVDLIFVQAGYPIPEYGFTGKGARVNRRDYLDAVFKGYIQDYRFLADFFATAIERAR